MIPFEAKTKAKAKTKRSGIRAMMTKMTKKELKEASMPNNPNKISLKCPEMSLANCLRAPIFKPSKLMEVDSKRSSRITTKAKDKMQMENNLVRDKTMEILSKMEDKTIKDMAISLP